MCMLFFTFISDVRGLLKVLYDPDDTYSAGMKESINAMSSSKAFNICVVNNIASDPDDNSFYPVSKIIIYGNKDPSLHIFSKLCFAA